MIPGVHASLVVRRDPDEVRARLDRDGWPWLGRQGPLGTREVRLEGRPARPFRVRAFPTRGVGRSRTWHVRLEPPESGPATGPAIALELSVESLPSGGTARLQCSGRAARNLQESGQVQQSVVRLAANAYTRSFLEQVAAVIEGQAPISRATAERDAGSAS
jgi:hypothetical protein